MTQLTLRGFDADLERAIRDLSESEGISLNRAALRLLRRGAGLAADAGQRDCIGNSLDHLAGTWTEEEAREFLESIQDCRKIDKEMWE